MVHTSTCALTFVLSQELPFVEVSGLTFALNRVDINAMNEEVPTVRGEMNLYDLVGEG